MFKKYSSIENSYRQKHVMKVLQFYPEVANIKYSIREKIDGSNLQLFFSPGEKVRVGKRSCFITEEENFFDVWEVLNGYQDVIQKVQDEVELTGMTVRLFGELYGPGIQKRVDYGDRKRLAFFDVEVDGEMWSQREFEALMASLEITNLAPLLGYTDNLADALNWDERFDSKLSDKTDNPSEGIVIKPYEKEYNLGNGSRFILKKKSDIFAEKMNVKPKQKNKDESAKMISAKMEFQSYLNENRLQGIFSKHGPIEDMDQFGKYIQLMLSDAKEDFLKDFDTTDLTEKELKNIFKSGGKNVAIMLRSFM